MSESLPDPQTLDQLESRQDEVLRQLDELNLRLETVLAEWLVRLKLPEPRRAVHRPAA